MNTDEGYEGLVKRFANEDSEVFINNSFEPWHGAVVIKELFNRADGTFYILTDHLNPLIYGRQDVKKATEKFLQKKGNCLKIVMQFRKKNERSLSVFGDNDFLIHLREYADRISIFRADEKWRNTNSFMVTMTVTDNYAIRFQLENEDHNATATFNAGDAGKELKKTFEKILNESEKLQLKRFEDVGILEHKAGEVLI